MSKRILERSSEVRVPPAVVIYGDQALEVSKACYVKYSEVETESVLGDVRPDILLFRPGKPTPLVVEIAVTHFSGKAKRRKLRRIDYPCIEIDVSKAVDWERLDTELLENLIIHSDDEAVKRWLCIPNYDRHVAPLVEKERLERDARERSAKLSAWQKSQRNKRIEEARKARHSRMNRRAESASAKHALLDIPVDGEALFCCPRTVWQQIIFRDYIDISARNGRGPGAQATRLPVSVEVASIEYWFHRHGRDYLVEDLLVDEHLGHPLVDPIANYLDALVDRDILRLRFRPENLKHHSVYEVVVPS